MQTVERRVILAGATGLVGGRLLKLLLDDPEVCEVHAVGRRALTLQHPKLQVHVVDFSFLPKLPEADEVYLALGTTIRVAGSRAAFRAVDLYANLAVAKASFRQGCSHVGLVSAAGANAKSSMFYNRVKGELEDALKKIGFSGLVIVRPSLLLDDRSASGQPSRLGESVAIPIFRMLTPLLSGAYRPVWAQAVAQALANVVPGANGVIELASDAIAQEAGRD
ncbi:nucleoside-diphosphate sugar epimerase [Stenotrophomonas maltophilia]